MVGRTFIPNEDMGEFTVHVDTPQGTSLEGTTEIAAAGGRRRSAARKASRTSRTWPAPSACNHFHIFFYLKPLDERDVTQDEVIDARPPDLAAHPGLRADRHAAQPARRRRGRRLRRSRRACSGPDIDKLYDYSQQLLAKAQKLPSLVDAKIRLSNANPEVHVAVDRARAADLGVRMSTVGSALRLMVAGDDEISTLPRGRRAVPGEDSRAREPAARHRGDRQAHGRRRPPAGRCASTTSPQLDPRLRPDAAARGTTASSRSTFSADVAPGHALDEASNDVRRLDRRPATCRPATRSA